MEIEINPLMQQIIDLIGGKYDKKTLIRDVVLDCIKIINEYVDLHPDRDLKHMFGVDDIENINYNIRVIENLGDDKLSDQSHYFNIKMLYFAVFAPQKELYPLTIEEFKKSNNVMNKLF